MTNLTIVNNRVRLEITRPNGSFDYVEVGCPVEPPQVIFNNTLPNHPPVTVDCAFLPNMPLMNFVIRTVKQGFNGAVIEINREGKSKGNLSHHLY